MSLTEIVAFAMLSIFEHIADIIDKLFDVFFQYIFSELLIQIDYQNVPKAGDHIRVLYKNISAVATYFVLALAAIALVVVMIQAQKTGSYNQITYILLSVVLFAVITKVFPAIFLFSQKVNNGICAEIMSHKVKGENIMKSSVGLLTTTGGELQGFDAIIDDVNYVMNLPATIVDEAERAVTESVDKAVDSVEEAVGDAYRENIEEPINKAYKKSVDSITESITGVDPKTRDSGGVGNYRLPAKKAIEAGFKILNIFINIVSLTFAISLICMKIFQTFMLLILFLAAPLVILFIILPGGYKTVINFIIGIWSLMAWNIAWAICIKGYFIAKLILTNMGSGTLSQAGLSGTGAPLHSAFGTIAILTVMMAVSTIVAIVGKNQFSGNISDMKRSITMIPAIAGGAAAGVVGGVAGGIGGAGLFLKNPAAFGSVLSSSFKSAGGMGSLAMGPGRFLNRFKEDMMSNVTGTSRDREINEFVKQSKIINSKNTSSVSQSNKRG